MKRITKLLFATGLLAALTTGCKEEYKTYSDAEYVQFADTMSLNMVLLDQDYFPVPVAATTVCDYDRTFAVEIVNREFKVAEHRIKAIEGVHYRLQSNTITIPAGQRAANVMVHGIYDNLEPADTAIFSLKLIMPEQIKSHLYEDETRVKMLKSCPFEIDDFTGWCVVTSMFLNNYPGVENTSIQRLIRTEQHPTEPNTIIMRNWLFTGYDITIRLDTADPAKPYVTMDRDQILSDETSVFGQILGDDRILVTRSPNYISSFSSCEKNVELWIHVYVEKVGVTVGTVGHFYNIMEWISDEEAERLQREEGM